MGFLNFPYETYTPSIGPNLTAASDAAVLGRTVLGAGAVLGNLSVIRADGHDVKIGADFSLGRAGTVHIAHETLATYIGDGVVVGADAVVHACTVGASCVIGAGGVILDGSVLQDGVVMAPGAVAYPRSVLDSGMLYAGAPAKPVRPLEPGELEASQAALRAENLGDVTDTAMPRPTPAGDPLFVAANARISGDVHCAAQTGIWFGCVLDAGKAAIRIGARTNVQDNARLTGDAGDIEIGADVTIGHNVIMSSCRVAEGSLIGISSRVAPGTVVERNVMLAAGAVTEPGQVLTEGFLWAGNPARPKRELSASQSATLLQTIPSYISYAAAFATSQADAV